MQKYAPKLVSLIIASGLSIGILSLLQSFASRSPSPPDPTLDATAQADSKATPQVAASPLPASPAAPAPDVTAQPTRLEIDLSQRQVILYNGDTRIRSYPIAIGREGWETPTGDFQVMQMLQDPTWINPLSDEVIQGGDPNNPLGAYWIGFWTDGRNWIGFHGTPNPETVGQAISHGCIRMHNEDIEALFHEVSPGMPVTVVQ